MNPLSQFAGQAVDWMMGLPGPAKPFGVRREVAAHDRENAAGDPARINVGILFPGADLLQSEEVGAQSVQYEVAIGAGGLFGEFRLEGVSHADLVLNGTPRIVFQT